MWVSAIQLTDVKSFQSTGPVSLSKSINVLIGPNNAGKSTLLRSIFALQNSLSTDYIRKGSRGASINLWLSDILNDDYIRRSIPLTDAMGQLNISGGNEQFVFSNGGLQIPWRFNPNDQEAFIYPYFSKRKPFQYEQGVHTAAAASVGENFSNLVALADQIATDRFHPAHDEFNNICEDILGFPISTFPATNGKQVGYTIGHSSYVAIEAMGEGTAQILGFLVRLCRAENKLFLIEELENDLHPKALKGLLRLIVKKSANNQFIISTHSNIVAKYLGAETNTKLFSINMDTAGRMPVSSISMIGNDAKERQTLLEDLGYEANDYNFWQGWLFLEEASAEYFIREYFIPWFVLGLKDKLRTVSAVGVNRVEAAFDDFNRLFLFTHLESIYKNKAWAIVDGDPAGVSIVEKLCQKYPTWDANHFLSLANENFEQYYPSEFSDDIQAIGSISDKQQKVAAKNALREKVIGWIKENPEDAKEKFRVSAAEIISILEQIAQKLI